MKIYSKMDVVCSCFFMGLSFAHEASGKGNGNECRSVCKSGKNLNFVDKNENVFCDNRVGKNSGN